MKPTDKYHWDAGFWGDQGATPMCTGYAGVHLLADGPVTQPKVPGGYPLNPVELYRRNQDNDRQMGYNWAEGASTLALAKSLVQLGFAKGYYWGYNLNSLVQAVLLKPVCVGINWYEGMDSPDRKHGIIRAMGRIRGGHEILVNGVDLDDGMFRLKNSWGRNWGHNGHCYLPFEDMERLIAEDGDVLMLDEVKKTA